MKNCKMILVFLVALLFSFSFTACVKSEKLAAPQNLKIENSVLSWDEVENAVEYTVLVDDQEYTVTESEYDLSYLTQAATYEISVCAVGDGKNYTNSEYVTIAHTVYPVTEGLKYILNEDGASYTVCKDAENVSGVLVIPSTYNQMPVTKVDGFYNTSITKLIILDGVEEIGASAFSKCESLTEVTIPNSVTRIESGAFKDSKNLSKVKLSNNLKYIRSNAFNNTAWYNAQPEGFITNGEVLYFYKSNSTSNFVIEEFPSTVKYIVGGVFYSFDNLTKVILPDNISFLGEGVFMMCKALTSVKLPSNLTKLPDSIFYNCASLQQITLPETITEIGAEAFYSCRSLQNLNLPASVTSIGDSAFYGCTSIQSIDLPAGIESIGYRIFMNCTSLQNVNLPVGITSIGDYAFNKCEALKNINIPNSVTSIGDRAFNNCISLQSIDLPVGITSIGNNAFYGCESLTNIEISKSVTIIKSNALSRCLVLTSINFDGTMAEWLAIEKGEYWCDNTGDFTVICTDGKLDKDGNVVE